MHLAEPRAFELAPAGTSLAVCIQLIDLGLQQDTWEDEPRTQHKCQVTWELPHHLDADYFPLIVSREITMSLHEKSTLRAWCESMLGHELSRAERRNFAMKSLLGCGCLIEIDHVKTRKGRDFAKVRNLVQAPDGQPVPKPVNPIVYFSLERPEFDPAVFAALTPWLQEKISGSETWTKLQSQLGAPDAQAALPAPKRRTADIIDDDILDF